MNNDIVNDAFYRGFAARMQILSVQPEKQAMLQGAMRTVAPAVGAVRRAIPAGVKNVFKAPPTTPAPSVGPIEAGVAGLGGRAGGVAGSTAAVNATNPGILAQGMGAVTRNPVKSLAAAGALGAGAAGTAALTGANKYYGQQAQNAITELPNVVKDYMASQGAGPGMGGMMGKIMMFLQYLFGGQNANRNLAGNIAQFAAQSNRLTPLNRSQLAQGAKTLQTPLPITTPAK